MKKNWVVIGIFGFTAIFFMACDLFTGIPSKALIDKIDDQIKFAKAPKIEVSVVYNIDWGFSPQVGVKNCGDTRLGYSFEVTFTPNGEYALLGWRAYATADLEKLEEGWIDNPVGALEGTNAPQQIDDAEVELPELGEGGGTGKFTIHTTEPVTLIPFCRGQPRIISSSPNANTTFFPRSNNITIRFAGSMDKDTLQYGPGQIEIFRRAINDGIVSDNPERIEGIYYAEPGYEGQSLIIKAVRDEEKGISGPPAGSEITLTLGTEIKTLGGYSWEKPVTFVWQTRQNNCYVSKWEAEYNEISRQIRISWEQVGNANAKLRYKIYGSNDPEMSADFPFNETEKYEYVIYNVDPYNSAMPGSGRCYEAWIDLTSGSEFFPMEDEEIVRMWNIPGMKSDSTSSIRPIRSSQDFVSMNQSDWGLNKPNLIYIFDDDIEITGSGVWTPVGSGSANAFMGTIYGLGRTVVFHSTLAGILGQYKGLFGYLDGAVIHDLTVDYDGLTWVEYSGNGSVYIGGIAGYAAGNTILNNCTVSCGSGAGSLRSSTSSSDVYIGSMIGYMDGQGVIKNSRADLDLQVAKGNNGNIYAGTVAGNISFAGIPPDEPAISGLTVTGNVTVTNTNPANTVKLYIGGVAGAMNSESESGVYTLEDCLVQGNITATASGSIYTGGIAGNITNTANYSISVLRCKYETGKISVIGTGTGDSYAGGIAGASSAGINSCYAIGDISVESNGVMYAGGIVGLTIGQIERSWTTSNVNARRTTNNTLDIFAGGFAGMLDTSAIIRNCYALGNVGIDYNYTGTANLTAGGFAGRVNDAAIDHSFAKGLVSINSSTSGSAHAGGFIGDVGPESTTAQVSHSVALGDSTTAIAGAGAAVKVFRIGNTEDQNGQANQTLENNHSRANMYLGTSTAGYNAVPSRAFASSALGGTAANGETIIVSRLKNENAPNNFWTSPSTGNPPGVGFSSTVWKTSNLSGGHPLLTGVAEDKQITSPLDIPVRNISKNSLPLINGEPRGTITVANTAEPGSLVPFTLNPSTGYSAVNMPTVSGNTSITKNSETSYSFIMPDGDVTVNYTFTANSIVINKPPVNNGSYSVKVGGTEVAQAATDTTVTIEASPDNGYEIKSVTVTNANVTTVSAGVYSFVMTGVTNTVTVNVEFQALPFDIARIAPTKGEFSITIPPSGTLVTSARTDQTVRITSTPNNGYFGESVTVFKTGSSPEEIVYQNGAGDTVCEFIMPGFNISVRVLFAPMTYSFGYEDIDGVTDNGSYQASAAGQPQGQAQTDQLVTITSTPERGYTVGAAAVYRTDQPGTTVQVNGNGSGPYTFNMPPYNVTVKLTFVKDKYAIDKASTSNGSFAVRRNGAEVSSAEYEDTLTIATSPASRYRVDTVTVYKTGSSPEEIVYQNGTGPFEFEMPDYPVTVRVIFTNTYTIIREPTGGNPAGGTFWVAAAANQGSVNNSLALGTADITYYIRYSPSKNYVVNSVNVYNTEDPSDTISTNYGYSGNGSSRIYYYSFTMPACDISVEADFVLGSNEIIVTTVPSNGGGTASVSRRSGSGSQSAAEAGSVWRINATPRNNTGDTWRVKSIEASYEIGGEKQELAIDSNNDFEMPTYAVTVVVTFERFAVLARGSPGNGNAFTVTVNGVPVAVSAGEQVLTGSTVIVKAVPNAGYTADGVTFTPSTTGATATPTANADEWSFSMPTANVTVNANFTAITYTITPTSGGSNGSTFTVTGTPQVGQTITINASAASGYQVNSVSVTKTGSGDLVYGNATHSSTYSFLMPASNIAVSVTFELIPYTITPTSGGSLPEGTFTVTTASPYTYGKVISIATTPGTGYQVAAVTVDGVSTGVSTVTANAEYSFSMPNKNVAVGVTFELIPYTITPTSGGSLPEGTFTVTTASPYTYGKVISIATTPGTGYQVAAVTVDGVSTGVSTVTANAEYSFTMPDSNVNLAVTFAADEPPGGR